MIIARILEYMKYKKTEEAGGGGGELESAIYVTITGE